MRLPWPTALGEPTFIVSFFRITFLSLALFEYYILGLLRVVRTGTGILFVVILALMGVTRKTERTFARTAGLFSSPQRPVGVIRIQISRCFVV